MNRWKNNKKTLGVCECEISNTGDGTWWWQVSIQVDKDTKIVRSGNPLKSERSAMRKAEDEVEKVRKMLTTSALSSAWGYKVDSSEK